MGQQAFARNSQTPEIDAWPFLSYLPVVSTWIYSLEQIWAGIITESRPRTGPTVNLDLEQASYLLQHTVIANSLIFPIMWKVKSQQQWLCTWELFCLCHLTTDQDLNICTDDSVGYLAPINTPSEYLFTVLKLISSLITNLPYTRTLWTDHAPTKTRLLHASNWWPYAKLIDWPLD